MPSRRRTVPQRVNILSFGVSCEIRRSSKTNNNHQEKHKEAKHKQQKQKEATSQK